MKVVAIVPARSGSKGLPDKNIRLMNGKPLLVYSIEQAIVSKYIDRVIVSTDSAQYAEIAKTHGADVPFLRPENLSQDNSLDIDVFTHTLNTLREQEQYIPDIVVHLRPTHPVRETSDIDAMIGLLIEHSEWDSVRSISPMPTTPYKMWLQDKSGELVPLATCDITEAYNAPRQSLPTVYLQNACIDVVRANVITEQVSMTGKRIGGYAQPFDFDIDSLSDFMRAELYLEIRDKLHSGNKLTVCFDIDGLLATKTVGNDYRQALPNTAIIDTVNTLYHQGHTIVVFTARSSATGIDWKELTERQLAKWNVCYSELLFGKPTADIYIDDRAIDIGELVRFTEKGGKP